MKYIEVKGAREHNLKNIDVRIPKSSLTVITGPSGSGKSTLAFDILHAEGQRNYIQSLSAYARQFLDKIDKPNVDEIKGLSPTISIDQKPISNNPRSTVGTVTEIYDYMRLLYAHTGEAFCYSCGRRITKQTPETIINTLIQNPGRRILILAPVALNRKGTFKNEFEKLAKEGFLRVIVDNQMKFLDEDIELDRNKKHNIFLVVDRLKVSNKSKQRISESVELALKLGSGVVYVKDIDSNEEEIFSEHFACPYCGISYKPITPQSFSFNSPLGACEECFGIGVKHQLDVKKLIPNPNLSLREGAITIWNKLRHKYYQQLLFRVALGLGIDIYTPFNKLPKRHQDIILHGYTEEIELKYPMMGKTKIRWEGVIKLISKQFSETESPNVRNDILNLMNNIPCPACNGMRLNRESLSVKLLNKNIMEVANLSISDSYIFFKKLEETLDEFRLNIASRLLKEIKTRLRFLIDAGLGYLTLNRGASTLSGGESQRIRLATQVGSRLEGITYVMDEPSIGLHPKDTDVLIQTLKNLRDKDNTVIVVEHDEMIIRAADHIIDMGPGAGREGGKITATGTPEEIENNPRSLTGLYLSKKLAIEPPQHYRKPQNFLLIKGAKVHNLKNINVKIPTECFVCVTGVSGSGKSSLILDCFYEYIEAVLHGKTPPSDRCDGINHLHLIDKIIKIDQTPIGRTPRSNPATYTGVFTDMRELFAKTQDAKARGFTPSRFSFNVKGGRCEKCKGEGLIKIEMQFLPDIYVKCDLCKGKRYNDQTLSIKYNGKSIYDVLEMTISQAYEFFRDIPRVASKLNTLREVGLGYLKLGQSATTLSGGEAQRVKIAKHLIQPPTGKTIYILDEPSIGLHMDDIKKLIKVLNRLVEKGNSVIIIEHNLDIIKSADYIIDLGPESGDMGGEVVAFGSPREIVNSFNTHTTKYLRRILGG